MINYMYISGAAGSGGRIFFGSRTSEMGRAHIDTGVCEQNPPLEKKTDIGTLAFGAFKPRAARFARRRAPAAWRSDPLMRGFYYHFSNLCFNKSQNLNEFSAAHVAISFVSSEIMRFRLLK